MSVDAILEAIRSLSPAERAELFVLLDDLTPPEAGELAPDVARMLDERVAEADANPDAAIPWEQVYQESLKRVRR